MRWSSALETGNSVVDAEHREIIALLDKLELMGDSTDGPGVLGALEQLTDYVFVHFQMEEKLMRREEYPPEAISAHTAEHRELSRQTQEYVERYQSGSLTSVTPIVDFLDRWFRHHIDEVDRAFAAHVRTRHGTA